MQFQIPQFIEVEDKIFGPLTFRQFVYLAGGAGTCYLVFRVLPFFLALPVMGIIMGFVVALAFFQYNGRPFIVAIEHGFYFFLHPKLYLWNNERKRQKATAVKTETPTQKGQVYIPKLSDIKLHELAWALDIKERIAAGVADEDERQRPASGAVAPVMTMRDVLANQGARRL